MKLRRIPRTPEQLREEPHVYPDAIHLRPYESNVGKRYLVEARKAGRCLGDRDFATVQDARTFAELECKWHAAKLVDETRG
jgi:hypothetical protein